MLQRMKVRRLRDNAERKALLEEKRKLEEKCTSLSHEISSVREKLVRFLYLCSR